MQTGKGFEAYRTGLCPGLFKEAQHRAFLLRAKVENLSQGDLIPGVGWRTALPRVSFRLPALTWLSLTAAAWLLSLSLAAGHLGTEHRPPWKEGDASLEMSPGKLTHPQRIQLLDL